MLFGRRFKRFQKPRQYFGGKIKNERKIIQKKNEKIDKRFAKEKPKVKERKLRIEKDKKIKKIKI